MFKDKELQDLDEAIKHANEVYETCNNKACSEDHRQLRDWLIELKEYKQEKRTNEIINETRHH